MKTSFKLMVCTLLSISVLSCGQDNQTDKEPKQLKTLKQKENTSLSEAKTSSNNELEKRIIPVDQGILMYDEFDTNRTQPLAPILRDYYQNEEFVDSKFVYFSLEDLNAYMSFLEQIKEENPEKDVSGVRVYFGAYPNLEYSMGKKVKYPGQQTVFMAPTMYIGEVDDTYPNMNNLPFYIEATEEDPYKGKFIVIEDLMLNYKKQERIDKANPKNAQKSSLLNISTTNSQTKVITNTLFNEGQISPPPY